MLRDRIDDGLGVLTGVRAQKSGNVVLVHQLGDSLHGLVGFALIIIKIELKLLAQNAALGVDLIKRDAVAVLVCFTKSGLAACERSDHADLDGVLSGTEGCTGKNCKRGKKSRSHTRPRFCARKIFERLNYTR